MDKDTLLAKYRDAFTYKKQEIAKAIDASFISGKLHDIRTFSDEELDVLAQLMPPEQNIRCVEILKEADDLDKFTKFSAALFQERGRGEGLFPFVRDAPHSLHPSYRTWKLRTTQGKLQKTTHLLVLTTNPREFECAVRCGSAYPQVNVEEKEELWGDVNIFHITVQTSRKRVVLMRVWERRFLSRVLDVFAPHLVILSLPFRTCHLPRVEGHGRVWKNGDAVVVESVQVEGRCRRAHQRIHELKLWNLLKWDGVEEVVGSCGGQDCRLEESASVSHSLEMELLSEQCQTLSLKKVHHLMHHPLYELPRPHPTCPRLHFTPYEKIGALECREDTKEWIDSFYKTAEQRRSGEKRGKAGDIPIFFCLGTLRRAAEKEEIQELTTPLVYRLLHRVAHYFYIDAKLHHPS